PIMLGPLLALMLAAPQGAPALGPSPPPSPVAAIVVDPAEPVVEAGGTLQLRVQAVDAEGRPVPNALFMFTSSSGARFEGYVEPTGLVRSAATGTLPVTVTALVQGTTPVFDVIDVRMVPGPAARVDVSPGVNRLVAGQRMRYTAQVYSALGDERQDRIAWSSSAPSVATVTENGLVTAVGAGRAEITAAAGSAAATIPVEVVAAEIASIQISPSRPQARQGDVIRFSVTARDAGGNVIEGLTPIWSF